MQPNHKYSSPDHFTLAREVSDEFIRLLGDKYTKQYPNINPQKFSELANKLRQPLLAQPQTTIPERLQVLRDVVWQKNKPWPPDIKSDWSHDRLEVFRWVMQGLDPQGKDRLLAGYAKLGHIYEITGTAARNNYFNELRLNNKPIPGGARAFVMGQADLGSTLSALSKPVFEVVMTMHPTNTNSFRMMKAQRALALALEPPYTPGVRPTPSQDEVTKALRKLVDAKVLHQAQDPETGITKDAPLTVTDETQVVLNYLDNLYEDLPRVYRQYAIPLGEKYGAAFNPLDLKLNIALGSWGSSGDKDGNDNVTAETTLEAIALHTQKIVEHYKADLKSIKSPELQEWKQKIDQASAALAELVPHIEGLRKEAQKTRSRPDIRDDQGDLLSRNFDNLSQQLAEIRKPLVAAEFEKDIIKAHESAPDDRLVNLARRVRTFGFNFSKIEYRETAKQYARVVELLVPDYKELSPAERQKKISEFLTEEGKPATLLAKTHSTIIAAGATHPYSDKNAFPIAYHTMKRMELARDFPDMIRDSVLAECGQTDAPEHVQAQGVTNLLEALFVQRMVQSADGRKPMLGIVPLFEEPDTMQRIDEIMRAAYENPIYRKHLKDLQHGGKEVQQVQIAHSDNARRSGLAAARALIHEAHHKLRKLNDEFGIVTQFFEGGSISDAYRNGVRAVSATTDDFGLHEFAKFTFQGGDLLNYFNSPSSSMRLFTRGIINSAKKLAAPDYDQLIRQMPVANRVAIAAMKRTLDDYRTGDFTLEKMGVLLKELDYDGEKDAGTLGSRAGTRGMAKVDSTQMGVQVFVPTPIDKVRTIGFSETWQHAGILPSYLGTLKLESYLGEEVAKALKHLDQKTEPLSAAESHFKNRFNNIDRENPKLSAMQLHMLYNEAPAFRDDQDRALHAVAMTDPHAFAMLEKKIKQDTKFYQDGNSESYLQAGLDYLKARVVPTYEKAGNLAFRTRANADMPEGDMRRNIARQGLPRIAEVIADKSQYRDFLTYLKFQRKENGEGKLTGTQRSLIHNALDTVAHGRFLPADDPEYGKHIEREAAAKRAAGAAPSV